MDTNGNLQNAIHFFKCTDEQSNLLQKLEHKPSTTNAPEEEESAQQAQLRIFAQVQRSFYSDTVERWTSLWFAMRTELFLHIQAQTPVVNATQVPAKNNTNSSNNNYGLAAFKFTNVSDSLELHPDIFKTVKQYQERVPTVNLDKYKAPEAFGFVLQ